MEGHVFSQLGFGNNVGLNPSYWKFILKHTFHTLKLQKPTQSSVACAFVIIKLPENGFGELPLSRYRWRILNSLRNAEGYSTVKNIRIES